MRRHLVLLLAAVACGVPEPKPVPEHAFAFAVFGDGPYFVWERGRFARLVEDLRANDLAFLLHVGDIFDRPCEDGLYRNRLATLDTIGLPVIYTPGDNEWTDCHANAAGGYDPLDRLATLRRIFFAHPRRSLGPVPLPLATQADDSAFSAFPEHARWTVGGVQFVTVHMVGSDNGLAEFDTRGPAHDAEVAGRTAAAIRWMRDGFAAARDSNRTAVVIAFHGEPGLERARDRQLGYETFVDALEDEAQAFAGEVLVIHGDWHELHIDNPLRDRETGAVVRNLTRLETFGSPDIGWVRVVVDTLTGQFVEFEPRLMPRKWILF